MQSRSVIQCLAMMSVALSASTGRAQHSSDIWVGRSAAGQLRIDNVCDPACGFDPAKGLTLLQPDALGGFSNDSPGFDRITANQPAEDMYMLAAGAQIWLQIHSDVPNPTMGDLKISPALFIIEPLSGYYYPYSQGAAVDREVKLGTHQLHQHLFWALDPTDPAYDPGQCVWEMTVRLIDKGTTGYSPSEPFTLRFARLRPPVPGDFYCDGDVDEDDLMLFVACHSGPSIPLSAPCRKFDLDGDGDADAEDFAVFQRCWSGAGVPGNSDCAD